MCFKNIFMRCFHTIRTRYLLFRSLSLSFFSSFPRVLRFTIKIKTIFCVKKGIAKINREKNENTPTLMQWKKWAILYFFFFSLSFSFFKSVLTRAFAKNTLKWKKINTHTTYHSTVEFLHFFHLNVTNEHKNLDSIKHNEPSTSTCCACEQESKQKPKLRELVRTRQVIQAFEKWNFAYSCFTSYYPIRIYEFIILIIIIIVIIIIVWSHLVWIWSSFLKWNTIPVRKCLKFITTIIITAAAAIEAMIFPRQQIKRNGV